MILFVIGAVYGFTKKATSVFGSAFFSAVAIGKLRITSPSRSVLETRIFLSQRLELKSPYYYN